MAPRPESCGWCGRTLPRHEMGRRRRYCRQSCRQRAYEHRADLRGTGIPENSVVLSAEEAEAITDRAFQVRCAAEDVATAVHEGATADELSDLCADLVKLAAEAERLR